MKYMLGLNTHKTKTKTLSIRTQVEKCHEEVTPISKECIVPICFLRIDDW